MEMKRYKAHCLVVPYPVTGHLDPMLQFSKRLLHKGVKVTIALTKFMFSTMQNNIVSSSISIGLISDGKEDGEVDIPSYLNRLIELGSKTLTELILKLSGSECPVDYVVYDSFLPWVLEVSKGFELPAAVFFTQSCAVSNIYYRVYKGTLKLPLTKDTTVLALSQPMQAELMSFISRLAAYPHIYEFFQHQFSNIEKPDLVLFNNFYKLEPEVADGMAKLWPVRTIGPTVPSVYLDNRLKDDKEYGLNMLNPNKDTCIKWLNDKPNESVVYVSFGSLAELSKEQMEEVAWGLKASDSYFLWVVRASEGPKLPKTFLEETSEKGLVVPWCPQLEVLAHEAVGCFVSRCGWNSTMEALSPGVPVVAMPHWFDQFPNSTYVMEVWGNGLKVKANEKDIVSREEVKRCLREAMEGVRGKEIRKNAIKWKELAREAVDEGGSSEKNIDELIAKMIPSKLLME